MKIQTYFLIILFLKNICIFAQSDFKKGYILTINNDTVKGLIDLNSDANSIHHCKFKTDENAPFTEYYPSSINGYRFDNGRYYISKNIKIDSTLSKIFLEYLVDGISDLYFFRDKNGDHFLIEKKPDDFVEVHKFDKTVRKNGVDYTTTDNRYIGILKLEFQDTPELYHKIENMAINRATMTNLLVDYHNKVCNGKCIVYTKENKKTIINFGIVTGLNFNKIILIKPSNDVGIDPDFLNGKFKWSAAPSLGCFFNINEPDINEKLSFQYEIKYSQNKQHATITKADIYEIKNFDGSVDFKWQSINQLFYLNYKLTTKQISPSIFLGCFYNISFSQMNKEHLNAYINNVFSHEINTDLSRNSNYFGLLGGVGINYSAIGKHGIRTELMYQFTKSLIIHFDRSLMLQTISLNILINLTKQ